MHHPRWCHKRSSGRPGQGLRPWIVKKTGQGWNTINESAGTSGVPENPDQGHEDRDRPGPTLIRARLILGCVPGCPASLSMNLIQRAGQLSGLDQVHVVQAEIDVRMFFKGIGQGFWPPVDILPESGPAFDWKSSSSICSWMVDQADVTRGRPAPSRVAGLPCCIGNQRLFSRRLRWADTCRFFQAGQRPPGPVIETRTPA